MQTSARIGVPRLMTATVNPRRGRCRAQTLLAARCLLLHQAVRGDSQPRDGLCGSLKHQTPEASECQNPVKRERDGFLGKPRKEGGTLDCGCLLPLWRASLGERGGLFGKWRTLTVFLLGKPRKGKRQQAAAVQGHRPRSVRSTAASTSSTVMERMHAFFLSTHSTSPQPQHGVWW